MIRLPYSSEVIYALLRPGYIASYGALFSSATLRKPLLHSVFNPARNLLSALDADCFYNDLNIAYSNFFQLLNNCTRT